MCDAAKISRKSTAYAYEQAVSPSVRFQIHQVFRRIVNASKCSTDLYSKRILCLYLLSGIPLIT